MNELEKAREFLLITQNKDGSWNKAKTVNAGPDYLQKPLVLTSEAVRSLLYLDLDDTKPISLGISYCLKDNIEDNDPPELLASKLSALNLSNAEFIEKEKKKLSAMLIKKQDKKGFWKSFPYNSNLTNSIIVESLDNKEKTNRLNSWLLTNKAKDGIGWGLNEKTEKSQVSFTANCFLSLMKTESFYDEKIEKFFLEKQMNDGGWPSSELTYPYESTLYSTSLVVLSLMYMDGITKEVKRGIKFIIDNQLDDGSWGLKKDDKEGEYFTTYYAIKTLAYYNYLKDIDIKDLNDSVTSKVTLNRFIFNSFENDLRNKYMKSYLKNILLPSLATTQSALERRKAIISILQEKGEMDVSDMIDNLKDKNFKIDKKTHLAQIKNDMKALTDLGVILENKNKYFLTMRVL